MKNTTAEVFKFCLTAFFSFSFLFLSAQIIPDSIPVGIISVKRPPVPASYRINLVYFDPDSLKNRKHISEISFRQIVFGDSVFNPTDPQPLADYRSIDAASFAKDSDAEHFTVPITSAPAKQFDWNTYLKTIPWQFQWSDSSKSDSARFEYSIDKKGNATIGVLPWKKREDSTQVAFEKCGLLYLGLLRQWYPAKKIKGYDRSRTKTRYKNIACKVIVTLYAYDPNAGRLLPIESKLLTKPN